jgi:hypothetical protein
MSDDVIIRPTPPPLSHMAEQQRKALPWMRYAVLGLIALLSVSGVLWVFTLEPSAPTVQGQPVGITGPEPAARAAEETPERAPFDALTYERQREAAQAAAATFIEAQIALTEPFAVDQWAQAAYRDANQLAKQGDQAYLEERYEKASEFYGEALKSVQAIASEGEALLAGHLTAGQQALDARQTEAAAQAFADALRIQPGNKAAEQGAERASLLPQVIETLRNARNHELSERWAEALAAYDAAARIDPETAGLDILRQRTATLRDDAVVRRKLSEGFAALDSRRFDEAKRSFGAVLDIRPGNEVAAGGLQQVAQKSELGRIAGKQQEAELAAAQERWKDAQAHYEEVLAIDPNIEFAKLGRSRMSQLADMQDVLERIRDAPDRLSSARLYGEAREILAEAEALDVRAPAFSDLLATVANLIERYGQPVAVTLLSDARTEVLLSSVGKLGRFDNKTLELRPGEYTVVGSQDGCRDVRHNFVVRPDMQPITIRCNEVLSP